MANFDAGGVGGGIVPTLGKRKADESTLNDSDRFAKRFNLLSLDLNAKSNTHSNYYIPISSTRNSVLAANTTTAAGGTNVQHLPQASEDAGHMQIDDTRDRVYIHNLDDELAESEPEEEKLIFLPDIERHFSRIPQQILAGRRGDEQEHQELVLYSVPKSLTVDEERDTVRKAIIESRRRAREKAIVDARQHDMNCKYDQNVNSAPTDVETAHGYGSGYVHETNEPDPDAMDMD